MTPERIAELAAKAKSLGTLFIEDIRELLTALEAITAERDAAASINRILVHRCGQLHEQRRKTRKAVQGKYEMKFEDTQFQSGHNVACFSILAAIDAVANTDIPDAEPLVLRCYKCHGTTIYKRISDSEIEIYGCGCSASQKACSECGRLREVLQPFAQLAEDIGEEASNRELASVMISDLRNARAALASKPEEDPLKSC